MLGIAALLATLCSLSYPIAIPSARTRQEASDLLWLTFLGGVCITPLATVLAAVLVSRISTAPVSGALWVAGAATTLLLSVWGGLRAIASREDLFRSVSVSGVGDSGMQAGGQIALGQLSWGPLGLAGGYLAGKAVAVLSLLWVTRKHIAAPHRLWAAARDWIRYTLLLTPTVMLNQASVTAVSAFVAALFGAELAGQFALAARMLAVPSVLLGQAIATVFYPKIARMTREGRSTTNAVASVATVLSSVAWPIFGITLLLGPELFTLIFGAEWSEAGATAAILSPWLALNLVSSPISSVIMVRDRLGPLLALGVLEASMRFGALALGAAFDRWHLSLMLYSATGVAISLYVIAWVLHLSGGSLIAWLRSWSKARWGLLVAMGSLAALKPYLPTVPVVALSCALCATAVVLGGRQLLAFARD
jgi:O-antigen/teichoic acid export membrane protein